MTIIDYKYLSPGAQSPDLESIGVRSLETGEEAPRHRIGDVIRLLDTRLEDPAERSFEEVDVSLPVITGFVESGMSLEIIFVLVTDARSAESE